MENFISENDKKSEEEKKEFLYYKQKELLDTFLFNGAISRAQYDKSLNCLKEKLLFREDKE